MEMTNELIKGYKKDLSYIFYNNYNYKNIIIINTEKFNNEEYKNILSKHANISKKISEIKEDITKNMNTKDSFTTSIEYFDNLGNEKANFFLGYKKDYGFFLDIIEKPYKLSINEEKEMNNIIEFDKYRNIPKGSLINIEESLKLIENLLAGNPDILTNLNFHFHEFNLSKEYPTPKTKVVITSHQLQERTDDSDYTKILKATTNDNNITERINDYCKKITSFIHCPISKTDYNRMEAFSNDNELIEKIYEVIPKFKLPIGAETIESRNKIFFWYSIALISITSHNRDEYNKYLEQLMIETMGNYDIKNNDFQLLKRNFDTLKKDYPNLEKYSQQMEEYLKNKQ